MDKDNYFLIKHITNYNVQTKEFTIEWESSTFYYKNRDHMQIYDTWKHLIKGKSVGCKQYFIVNWKKTNITIDQFIYPDYAINYLNKHNIKHDYKI